MSADQAKLPRSEDWRLVYVEGPWAWFTDDFEAAWGDDWNDAPHDCNAGSPYTDRGGRFLKVAYDGELEVAGTNRHDGFGYLSVEQINAGEGPWLYKPSYGLPQYPVPVFTIPGGVSLHHFRDLVQRASGRVYEASNPPESEASHA